MKYIWVILQLNLVIFASPSPEIAGELKNLSYLSAFKRAQSHILLSGEKDHQLLTNLAIKLALKYHNARIDPINTIKSVLYLRNKQRLEYLQILLENPTLDISINDNYFLKEILEASDYLSMELLINNPGIDLSFDHNYLLMKAEIFGDFIMVDLLMDDQNVQMELNQVINHLKHF